MPKAHVTWTGKLQFNAEDRYGHQVLMEASPQYGGEGKGITPMELLLSALGGCAGIDIVTMLKARGQNLVSYEVEIQGIRKEELPKTFQSVEVKFYLKGDLDPDIVDKVLHLTMAKICPIAVMLGSTSNMKWCYEIIKMPLATTTKAKTVAEKKA